MQHAYVYTVCTVYTYAHIYSTHTYIYSKASLNRPTMGPTLSGPIRDVVGLES